MFEMLKYLTDFELTVRSVVLTVDYWLLTGDFKKQQMRMILPESASPVSVGLTAGVDIGGRSGRSHIVGAATASVPPALPPRCRVRFLSDDSHSHSRSHIHGLREKETHRLKPAKTDPTAHPYPHMRGMASSSHIFASSQAQTTRVSQSVLSCLVYDTITMFCFDSAYVRYRFSSYRLFATQQWVI
jgi:hypothetical protein